MSCCVCIAGSDSTGGAGIDVDRKVFATFGIRPKLICSATTVQGAKGLSSLTPASPSQLRTSLAQALGTNQDVVVKIGMLPDAASIELVAKELGNHAENIAWVIADPVMGPSAGGSWANDKWLAAYRRFMPAVVNVLTPNLAEARTLTGAKGALAASCLSKLAAMGFGNVVLTGGDSKLPERAGLKDSCVDHVALANQEPCLLVAKRSRHSCRGSGCTHASALAASLVKKVSLTDAVIGANMQVIARLAHAGGHQAPDMRYAPKLLRKQVKVKPAPPANKLARPLGVCPLVADASQLQRLCQHRPANWHCVQLRLKQAAPAEVRAQIAACAQLATSYQLALFVNDHWQAACSLKREYEAIAGVHLGQEDLASANLGAIKKAKLAVGISAHNLTETCIALAASPSYISFGPVFATKSKLLSYEPLGLAGLAKLSANLEVPCVAIGGITAARATKIVSLGISGIATIAATATPAGLARVIDAWEKGLAKDS